jgi:hypothetical protein
MNSIAARIMAHFGITAISFRTTVVVITASSWLLPILAMRQQLQEPSPAKTTTSKTRLARPHQVGMNRMPEPCNVRHTYGVVRINRTLEIAVAIQTGADHSRSAFNSSARVWTASFVRRRSSGLAAMGAVRIAPIAAESAPASLEHSLHPDRWRESQSRSALVIPSTASAAINFRARS